MPLSTRETIIVLAPIHLSVPEKPIRRRPDSPAGRLPQTTATRLPFPPGLLRRLRVHGLGSRDSHDAGTLGVEPKDGGN